MHELSLILNIIQIANEEVQKHKAQQVDAIELEIGDLSGVEYNCFDFAWNAAVSNTVLQKAEKRIHRKQGLSACAMCGQHFRVFQQYEPCPVCGNVLNDIISGHELKVKKLILS